MGNDVGEVIQATHSVALHACAVSPQEVEQRVIVFWVVRQHAPVGVDFASDVVVERLEADLVLFSLLEASAEIWEAKDPLEAAAAEWLASLRV